MRYLYVANWKMNMSFSKSLSFCTHNSSQLRMLATSADVVICPSFVALAPISELFKNSEIHLGAQSCSEHAAGSYTGEISAQSLAEIGVTHCIVGHSERRIYYEETTDAIVRKINLLYQNNIQPIICIGEKKEDFLNKATFTVLMEQLRPIIAAVAQQTHKQIIIAYEPVWSIGAGIIPEDAYLQEIFTWLTRLLHQELTGYTIQLLYGGSVNSKNIHQLKTIEHVDGFLIGGASTDFKEFSEIIETP